MKFIPLIWSGIWRKPGRAVLIYFQVCVAFALFGVLQGLQTGVEHLIAQTRADVLLVHGNLALFDPLGPGEGLTLWAMAIGAAVIRNALMLTAVTRLHVPAERSGTACSDGPHDAPLRSG